jgi:hypothetical protein
VGVVAVALEVDDGVDEVLEQAGPGELAVLGDVADEDDGDAGGLGEVDQFGAQRRSWLMLPGWRRGRPCRSSGWSR